MFSGRQLEYLRLGLSLYKEARRCFWIDVAEDIITSQTNDLVFPEEADFDLEDTSRFRKPDAGWPIQAQDLIRFVIGKSKKKSVEKTKTKIDDWKLVHIRDFLMHLSLVPDNFKNLSDETAIEPKIMLNYFGAVPISNVVGPCTELIGVYEYSENSSDQKLTKTIFILAAPDENRLLVEERIDFFRPATDTVIEQVRYEGFVFSPRNKGLFGLLRTFDVNNEPVGFKLYSFFGIQKHEDTILSFGVTEHADICKIKIGVDLSKEDSGAKPLIYKRYVKSSRQKSQRNSNVVNIFGKKKPNISTFGTAKDAVHPWLKHKLSQGVINGKGSGLADKTLNEEFLEAVSRGKYWLFDEYFARGVDVNCKSEKHELSALHLAAFSNAVPAVHELIKQKNLRYLVTDSFNRLPSHYAFMASDNMALFKFLAKKEREEAEAKGVDINKLYGAVIPS